VLTLQQRTFYRQVLTDQSLFTTPAIIGLLDVYGMELLDWLPETIRHEIADDFNIPLKEPLLSRVMSGIALLTTDSFFNSLPDFVMHCNVLSGGVFNPELWDPADAAECSWGITESMLLMPPETDNPFSDEIIGYISAVLDMEGIVTPPDVLRIVANVRVPFDIGSFSEDPEMAAAVIGFENSKTDSINQMLKENIAKLTQQLQSLPLINGDSAEIVKQLQQIR